MDYISTIEAAEKWGVSLRYVQRLLHEERIPGAKKYSGAWLLPADCEKPPDPRRERKQALSEPARYLPFVFLASAFQAADGSVEQLARQYPPEPLQAQYRHELLYLHGDFGAVISYASSVPRAAPTYLCANAIALISAVHLCDYESFMIIERRLNDVVQQTRCEETRSLAEAALATAYSGMFDIALVPAWLQECDRQSLPAEAMPWAAYLNAKCFQIKKEYPQQLAVARTALALTATPGRPTVEELYLSLMCGAACVSLNDIAGAVGYLDKALSFALSNGFITPLSESVSAFGGLMETHIQTDWPQWADSIVRQGDHARRAWFAFHNQYTQSHIPLTLTMQECHLARLLGGGTSYAEAGRRMHLSPGRIKNIASAIYAKLGIDSKQELKQFIL